MRDLTSIFFPPPDAVNLVHVDQELGPRSALRETVLVEHQRAEVVCARLLVSPVLERDAVEQAGHLLVLGFVVFEDERLEYCRAEILGVGGSPCRFAREMKCGQVHDFGALGTEGDIERTLQRSGFVPLSAIDGVLEEDLDFGQVVDVLGEPLLGREVEALEFVATGWEGLGLVSLPGELGRADRGVGPHTHLDCR